MTSTARVAAPAGRRRLLAIRLATRGGALPVAVGNIVSGLAAYVFLIVAARQLGPVRYSALSALWTLIFLVGPGCFAPMEQEVCRAAVARRSDGEGDRPVVVQGAEVGSVIAAGLLVVVGASSAQLRSRLFDGDFVLVVCLALGLVGYYFMHLSWGVLASRRHFRGYGIVAGSEGLARLVVVALLIVPIGAGALGAYGIAIGVAPFVAAYLGWRSEPVQLLPGPGQPRGQIGRAITYLLGASALKQFLLMVGPVAVQVLATDSERGEAGRYLAALALTRVPLFLFNAVLVALLPRLALLAAEGRRKEFSGILRQLSIAVALSIVAAALVAAAAGPSILRVFFGAAYALPARDLVVLTVGCGFYMLALVLSYGLIATDGHHWTVASWFAGCVGFGVVVAVGSSLGLLGRVEWGFLIATIVTATTMGLLLFVRISRSHEWLRHPAQLIGASTHETP